MIQIGATRGRPASASTSHIGSAIAELSALQHGVFALDRSWRYVYINPEAERLVRRSFGSLRGKVIWEEFPEAVGSTFDRVYRRVVDEQEGARFSEFYAPLDRWFEVTVTPCGDRGIVVLFRDLTADMKAQELVARHGQALLDPMAAELLARQAERGPLTARQWQILVLLARGLGTRAIARHLVLSEATVRNHVAGIFRALNVGSRLEAVAQARRRGLLPRD